VLGEDRNVRGDELIDVVLVEVLSNLSTAPFDVQENVADADWLNGRRTAFRLEPIGDVCRRHGLVETPEPSDAAGTADHQVRLAVQPLDRVLAWKGVDQGAVVIERNHGHIFVVTFGLGRLGRPDRLRIVGRAAEPQALLVERDSLGPAAIVGPVPLLPHGRRFRRNGVIENDASGRAGIIDIGDLDDAVVVVVGGADLVGGRSAAVAYHFHAVEDIRRRLRAGIRHVVVIGRGNRVDRLPCGSAIVGPFEGHRTRPGSVRRGGVRSGDRDDFAYLIRIELPGNVVLRTLMVQFPDRIFMATVEEIVIGRQGHG